MNRRDVSFLDRMFQHVGLENVNAIIINQLTKIDLPHNISLPYKGIRFFSVNEEGLSKSRNLALQYSRGDILIIADDDVIYEPNTLEVIKKYHLMYPNEGVLTFKSVGMNKKYSTTSYRHNVRTILKVSSCEITLKKDAVKSNFLFDERFGLGATYPIGEENIGLHDLIRSGVKARFVPKNIVKHSGISTGIRYSCTTERARGAAFFRMYGVLALPIFFWFAIKKYSAFQHKHSILTEIRYLFQGGLKFMISTFRKRQGVIN